jgi:hypothetical protein
MSLVVVVTELVSFAWLHMAVRLASSVMSFVLVRVLRGRSFFPFCAVWNNCIFVFRFVKSVWSVMSDDYVVGSFVEREGVIQLLAVVPGSGFPRGDYSVGNQVCELARWKNKQSALEWLTRRPVLVCMRVIHLGRLGGRVKRLSPRAEPPASVVDASASCVVGRAAAREAKPAGPRPGILPACTNRQVEFPRSGLGTL